MVLLWAAVAKGGLQWGLSATDYLCLLYVATLTPWIGSVRQATPRPTVDDVLHVRVPTVGVMEYTFQIRKELILR